MTCMKATLTAANNYRYTLIGDCRWTLHQFTYFFNLLHFAFAFFLHLPLDLNIPQPSVEDNGSLGILNG